VIRTAAAQIKLSGRQTMGVRLVNLGEGQSLVAIARNAEAIDNTLVADADGEADGDGEATVDVVDAIGGAGFAEADDLVDLDETETEAGNPEDDEDAE